MAESRGQGAGLQNLGADLDPDATESGGFKGMCTAGPYLASKAADCPPHSQIGED